MEIISLPPLPKDVQPRLRIISLGAGVQSTTMLLMALHGEITPLPDCAIFADTQWEARKVYEHLGFLSRIAAKHAFPILTVTIGNIRDDAFSTRAARKRFASLPLYVRNLAGGQGMLRRQCTREYKIQPITSKTRELLGFKPKQRIPIGIYVERWMGISWDERQRMRYSEERWAVNRYPLIERQMTRTDCLVWLARHDYPLPPKSACLGCPFHDDNYWRNLRDNSPDEFEDACLFDDQIRADPTGRVEQDAYLHRSLIPLRQVDFSTPEDRGQMNFFINECEGLCGV
jgi:hypothetical protein